MLRKYKLYKGHKLYFTKTKPYDGPITLQLCPPNTILYIFDKYIVDINHQYYELLEVKYLGITYKIEDFVKDNSDVVGINV